MQQKAMQQDGSSHFLNDNDVDYQDDQNDKDGNTNKRPKMTLYDDDSQQISDTMISFSTNDLVNDHHTANDATTTPNYGSNTYWDERYAKQFQQISASAAASSSSNILAPVTATEVVSIHESCNTNPRGDIDQLQIQHHTTTTNDNQTSIDITTSTAAANKMSTTTSSTLPYHSWYFTYDELRPILLPLLLGNRDEVQLLLAPSQDDDDDHENDTDDEAAVVDRSSSNDDRIVDHDESVLPMALSNQVYTQNDEKKQGDDGDETGNTIHQITNHDIKHDVDINNESDILAEDNDAQVEEDDDDDDDDDGDEIPHREGLAKDGPVSILEIGCGDVPLGAGLAVEFKDYLHGVQSTPDVPKFSIVSQIICTDYSQVVVDMMRRQYCNKNSRHCHPTEAMTTTTTKSSTETIETVDIGTFPLLFEVADARKLPYDDNSFHLVIEKGALDAVLSDSVSGVADCVQIVSECARVSSGSIVLISHLNAHTPSGLSWLDEVVFAGLKKSYQPNHNMVQAWDIEVHGNAEIVQHNDDDDDDDDDQDSESGIPPGTPGPAVYIIHKKMYDHNTINTNEPTTSGKNVVATTANTSDTKNSTITSSTSDEKNGRTTPTISVQFFSYQ